MISCGKQKEWVSLWHGVLLWDVWTAGDDVYVDVADPKGLTWKDFQTRLCFV